MVTKKGYGRVLVGSILLSFLVAFSTSDSWIHLNYDTAEVEMNERIVDQFEVVALSDEWQPIMYESHYFQGESLLFQVPEVVTSYEIVHAKTHEVVQSGEYDTRANGGIDFSTLQSGSYYVTLNDKLLSATMVQDESVFYSVMRHRHAKEVELLVKDGHVILTIKEISQLPENVYDILIDAGHGGRDCGASGFGIAEREETLKVSKYLAKRFEEHGLKVKLTRTTNEDPAVGEFVYKESPYRQNGRVEQVYQHKANYLISNHLNAFDTTQAGYQLFSSIQTSNEWAQYVSESFQNVNHEAFDVLVSPHRQSYGTFKYSALCPDEYLYTACELFEQIDYYYILRETGGIANHSYSLLKNNDAYKTVPNYGAESLLVEYAYIDNQSDNARWLENWELWAEAVVKGTVEYLRIEYNAPK